MPGTLAGHAFDVLCMCVIVQDEARRAFIALLRQAIRMANKTELQHCQDVGLKQSNWSAQCAGQQPFSGEAFIRMDMETKRWQALLTLQAYGLPREVNRAAPIVKVMAKMDLEPQADPRKKVV